MTSKGAVIHWLSPARAGSTQDSLAESHINNKTYCQYWQAFKFPLNDNNHSPVLCSTIRSVILLWVIRVQVRSLCFGQADLVNKLLGQELLDYPSLFLIKKKSNLALLWSALCSLHELNKTLAINQVYVSYFLSKFWFNTSLKTCISH